MNEELKIIIKAVTDDAKKNLAGVKEELKGVKEESDKASKFLGDSMKSAAKGIGIAIAAVAALTTAMIALGKSALEFQKTQAKLNSAFQSMGGSTEQATKTYKDLYRFLGDDATATEAAQSLARITTNEKDLAEWTKILQGAYATMGDALPVEGLAEAANETIKAGVASGSLVDALVWLGVSEDEFNAKLATTNSLEEREALLRSTLNSLYGTAAGVYERNNQALLAYNESQANLNIAMAQAASYTTPLLTSLNNLGATLLTVLAPALSTIAAYMTAFIQLIAEAIVWVGNFFGLFSGGSSSAKADVAGYRKAMDDYTASLRKGFQGGEASVEGVNNQIKELKRQTMGFDELNILQAEPASTGAGGGGGGGTGYSIPEPPNPADFGMGGDLTGFDDFTSKIEDAKEKLLVAAGLIAAIGAGLFFGLSILEGWDGTWKGLIKLWSNAANKLRFIAGSLLIISGGMMMVSGYSDAWVNGIDWGNLTLTLSGAALLIGGIALSFGQIVAGAVAVAAGLALVVLGIKDMIENGLTLENVIMVVAGALGIILGLFMTLPGTLAMTVAPIAALVAGLVMVIGGIIDIVNNGYSMEAVILIAVGAILILVGAVWGLNAALLANPITWVVAAIIALVATFVILWNECEGFRNFWKQMWEYIKIAFTAVWEWLKQAAKDIAQFFVDAWNWIKGAWDGAANFFKNIWANIKGAFSSVGKWFSDTFTSAWNGIKKAFSAVGSFFTGIWNTIKDIFGKVGKTIADAVSGAFKTAVNWVLEKAIGIINGFIGAINTAIGVINKIPGVNITKLKKLDVPQLATGGIVGSATLAMIGERGKEAVLPLENNTGWMDMLADRLSARSKTPTKIVLAVDGRELGYATLDSINDITQQTGKLQLVLA